jgi:putative nucleotidyltransferase with HDIG domain
MKDLPTRNPRPITDELRNSVVRDLSPEINEIRNPDLRKKVVEAWCYSLVRSSYKALAEVPPWGAAGIFFLKKGSQAYHLRGVARFAMKMADDFMENFPEVIVDRDIVIAGALCHDLGKPYEFDPLNQQRWKADPSAAGDPTFRHSVYGVHLALSAGLPERVAHICVGHSLEGQHFKLSAECTIVRHADHVWWRIAIALGLLDPNTIGHAGPTTTVRKTRLELDEAAE